MSKIKMYMYKLKSKNIRMDTTKYLLLIALFAALTAVGGFIRIPIPPVPVTLQTLFVYLSGYMLGKKGGATSQILFLSIGLIGVPIFTMGGGPGYIVKPSFGYLAGFPLSAWFIGFFVEKLDDPLNWWKLFTANCIGMFIILITGVIYLYICMNLIVKTDFTQIKALYWGVIIFLPGEILKIFLAIHLSRKLKPYIQF